MNILLVPEGNTHSRTALPAPGARGESWAVAASSSTLYTKQLATSHSALHEQKLHYTQVKVLSRLCPPQQHSSLHKERCRSSIPPCSCLWCTATGSAKAPPSALLRALHLCLPKDSHQLWLCSEPMLNRKWESVQG